MLKMHNATSSPERKRFVFFMDIAPFINEIIILYIMIMILSSKIFLQKTQKNLAILGTILGAGPCGHCFARRMRGKAKLSLTSRL